MRLVDDATLQSVVGNTNFHLDVDFVDAPFLYTGPDTIGWDGFAPIWGLGVPDIDKVLDLMDKYPTGNFRLDISVDGKDSLFVVVSKDDMQAFRNFFIAQWGNVAKVTIWQSEPN